MHSFSFKIYHDDTDFSGVMYHANYLKYFERARSDMLHQKGISHHTLKDELDALFLVRRLEIDYLKPSFLEDVLTVQTKVESQNKLMLILEQTMLKGDMPICKAKVSLVCVNQKGILKQIPALSL